MIFLFGSNGMLGNYLNTFLQKNSCKITPISRKNYDIHKISYESLLKLIDSYNNNKNDIIINCAGIIPQSSKDKEIIKKDYYKINSVFPVILSMIALNKECKFIHITTDCVFSGMHGNYDENSIHDEISDYGISKSLGELSFGTIIRTSIIGEEIFYKRSLVEWIKSNKNKEINGYINHYWNGVTCLQLSKIIYEIVQKNIYWNGVRHIFSPTIVNKFQLCSMINEIYKLNIKINKHETEKVDKSITTIYDKIFNIPELYEQIKEMKNYSFIQ